MKKPFLTTLLTLIITCLLTVFYSQDTAVNYKNRISIEGQIYPNFNQDIFRPKIKIRYNLNNKSALRINTNFNRSANYREIYEVNGPGVGSVEKIYSMYSFSLGYESQKRWKNSVIYSGLEGVLGFGRNDEYGSRTDSVNYVSDLDYNYQRPIQKMGLRVFFGGEYFLKSNLYLGTEFGIMLLKTSFLKGSYNVIDYSSLTSSDVTVEIPKSFNSGIYYSGIGVIRVGFIFK